MRSLARAALVLSLAALTLAAGCRKPASPADAYRAFAAAARAGDAEAVWQGLSEASRTALDARAKAAAAAAPSGVVPGEGKALVLADAAPRAARLKEVLVLRESGDAAVLAVELEGGGRGEVELVREGGRWRVVLPPS